MRNDTRSGEKVGRFPAALSLVGKIQSLPVLLHGVFVFSEQGGKEAGISLPRI